MNLEQPKNEIIKTPEIIIKEGVDFVFEQNAELAQIGTKEQYLEYLDTIFPESKLRDIVYHTSPNKIEKFRDTMFGTYFSYSPVHRGNDKIVHSIILNINNALVRPKPEDSVEVKEFYDKENRNYNNPTHFSPEGIGIYKYDASIEISTVAKEGVQIKVRNPEQIHILGSKDDIIKFKKFVSSKEDQIK